MGISDTLVLFLDGKGIIGLTRVTMKKPENAPFSPLYSSQQLQLASTVTARKDRDINDNNLNNLNNLIYNWRVTLL
jgi:hypothetical protein